MTAALFVYALVTGIAIGATIAVVYIAGEKIFGERDDDDE